MDVHRFEYLQNRRDSSIRNEKGEWRTESVQILRSSILMKQLLLRLSACW